MSIGKPVDDFELLLRVVEDPVRLLGRKSFALFEPFTFGCRYNLPPGAPFRELLAPHFEEFIREQFSASERWPHHLSATCYAQFLGDDDACALDLYVELRRKYFASHSPAPTRWSAPTASPRRRPEFS